MLNCMSGRVKRLENDISPSCEICISSDETSQVLFLIVLHSAVAK